MVKKNRDKAKPPIALRIKTDNNPVQKGLSLQVTDIIKGIFQTNEEFQTIARKDYLDCMKAIEVQLSLLPPVSRDLVLWQNAYISAWAECVTQMLVGNFEVQKAEPAEPEKN